MADEAPKKKNRSVEESSAHSTSSASATPTAPPLPVQVDTGRGISAYGYLPVHLQGIAGNTEQQQIPASGAPYPSIHGWGTRSHLPVPCYGPGTYPYRNVAAASPMEQLYRHPPSNLQPVPSLQLVRTQPPGQRPIQPATVQDGRSVCYYNHAVLAPIPVRQPSPIGQTGRPVTVPSAPNNQVVLLFKKAEPPKSATIGTNVAQRQEKRPVVVYHIPETPADQAECQSNAPQLTEPLAVLQRPLEATSSSSLDGRLEKVNGPGTQLGPREAHQPPLLQPEARGTAKGDSSLVNFMDEFQLPQELLSSEQFPDIEKLIASIEPLLPECLFPPIDPKEATQDAASQEMPLEGAKRDKEVKNIRSEAKGKRPSDRQIKREADVHHARTSSLPATRKSVSEGVVPIIDLCGSEDEEPRVHKSNTSKKHLEEPKLKHPAVSFISKGSFSQRQTTVMPPTAFIPRGHHLEGEGNSSSGQKAYERGGTTLGNASIAGPIYIVEGGGHPTPKPPVTSKDITKLKYERKLRYHSDTLGSGEYNTSPKTTSKRKNIVPQEKPKVSAKRSHDAAKKIHEPVMKICIPPLDKKRKRAESREPSGDLPSETVRGICKMSKEQQKHQATAKAHPAKARKVSNIEMDSTNQMPRSNLALQMMKSVQVLYPLGKNNLPLLPTKKIPSATSSRTLPETPTVLPRPLPQTVGGLPRQQPTSFVKPLPTLITKSSSSSQPKAEPSSFPKLVTCSLPKASLRHASKPPVSGTSGQATQASQNSRWKAQPSVVGSTYMYPRPPDAQMPGFWRRRDVRNQVPPNTPVSSPQPRPQPSSSSPVQEFNGATFIPWRTPPDDLEMSAPITQEQRPMRDMMKLRAQRQREEAACWTSAGRVKFFVEREKEMDTSIRFGYPWRH